ncbi:MAG TPA: hypothetical protein P5136_00565 [Methanofastidiosum sp.]|nr:hypothetical protein [Methanofastidiosum sp.]
MDEKTVRLRFNVSQSFYEKFKNKCDFYDLNRSEVGVFLIGKFLDGVFDKELELPID